MPSDQAMRQQVFTLSWLASQAPAGQAVPPTVLTKVTPAPWDQTALQTIIDTLGQQIPSWSWEVRWGPFYSADWVGGRPANTMFIAQQRDEQNNRLPVHVVAIAGTYGASLFDLLVEDLDIDPTPWPLKSNPSSQQQVTKGDWDGLMNLLGLGRPAIRDAVALIDNKDSTTLWFTGHSLGGALSPMLMLALMDPDSKLDTTFTHLGLWKEVKLLSTAGPSIGDKAFLDHFHAVFGADNPDITFIWNGLDVVPHAWNATTMQALTNPNIYGLDFSQSACAAARIKDLQAKAKPLGYQQWNPTPAFPGERQQWVDSSEWTVDGKFMAQLGYQHLNAYVEHFECTWFPLANPCNDPTGSNQAAQMLCRGGTKNGSSAASDSAELASVG